jgi:transcriptional regulator with XRE-family HTH domain
VFIDRFADLCKQKGVSANRACVEMGISRTSTAKWKAGSVPNGDTLAKIADYFGVTTDYLLGSETKKDPLAIQSEGVRCLSPEEISLVLKYRAASEERKESARLLLRLE